jgi:tetratricopeptide (TPR) repeat protein
MLLADGSHAFLNWLTPKPALQIPGDWEGAVREYFAQSPDLVRIDLKPLPPGRSGAYVLIASPWARRGKEATKLQPELVKFARRSSCDLRDEIRRFEELAQRTELVDGQILARHPYDDQTRDGFVVFGYSLSEAGTDVSPFYALALANPAVAEVSLGALLVRLLEWYGHPQAARPGVPLNVTLPKVQLLLQGLALRNPSVAAAAERVIHSVGRGDLAGIVSKTHNDLHLENILVARAGAKAYLIDFGSAAMEGSPCMDLARLESDLIYRLLPLDFLPTDVAAFERSLWGEVSNAPRHTVAGFLIAKLREVSARLLETPGGTAWFLAGRLIHGLRMLGNTWPEVFPYSDKQRQEGIIASLGVLTKKLEGVLGQSYNPKLSLVIPAPVEGTSDVERTLRWLFIQRKYGDAWRLALKVTEAHSPVTPAVGLLGALAGLSAAVPVDDVAATVATLPARLKTARDRGLKALYSALKAVRSRRVHPNKKIRFFEEARQALAQADEIVFEGIAADQLARAYQEAGEIDKAKITFIESLSLKEKTHDRVGQAVSLGGLALLHLQTREYDEATHFLHRDLALALEQGDLGAQAKIHNWLGQILLEDTIRNVVKALDHFDHSLRLTSENREQDYDPSLDFAFAYLGRGSCYTRSMAVSHAHEAEAASRDHFERRAGRSGEIGLALCDLLAGEIAFLQQHRITGIARIESGLANLVSLGELITYLDYGIRVCRFLRSIDQTEICRSLATRIRLRVKPLHYSHRLHSLLTSLESTP